MEGETGWLGIGGNVETARPGRPDNPLPPFYTGRRAPAPNRQLWPLVLPLSEGWALLLTFLTGTLALSGSEALIVRMLEDNMEASGMNGIYRIRHIPSSHHKCLKVLWDM